MGYCRHLDSVRALRTRYHRAMEQLSLTLLVSAVCGVLAGAVAAHAILRKRKEAEPREKPTAAAEPVAGDENAPNDTWPWYVVALVITAFAGAWWYYVAFQVHDPTNGWWTDTHLGVAGDSVAVFTALLTAAALFAGIRSMSLQREELRLQRKELIESRGELKKQVQAMEAQAQALAVSTLLKGHTMSDALQLELVASRDSATALLHQHMPAGTDIAATREELATVFASGGTLANVPEPHQRLLKKYAALATALQQYGRTRERWTKLSTILDLAADVLEPDENEDEEDLEEDGASA